MKTFVMNAIDRVGFMEKPVPKPGPADAIIKSTMALICTSDSHTVHGAIGARQNLTLGHEAVGAVYEVGSEVRLFKPGDRSGCRRHHSRLWRPGIAGRPLLAVRRRTCRLEVRQRQGQCLCRIFSRQ